MLRFIFFVLFACWNCVAFAETVKLDFDADP